MAFTSLPGIFENKLDGGNGLLPVNQNPVVIVIGEAAQGDTEIVYRVEKISDAARIYGKTGTLVRGMYEASVGGALNINLFRIGATPATLIDVGSSPGFEVTTVRKDDSAGTDYKIFFEASTTRIRIFRSSDDEVVFDNNPAYPLEAIDLGEVTVSGTTDGSAGSIGTLGTPITLAAANGVSGAIFTAGTDGLDPSRTKKYESLYNAYQLLEDQEIDVVVPMNVYLDDLNVMDMSAATVSSLGLSALSDYPDAGTPEDALGKLYVEEFEGVNYFWWWFPTNPAANVDTTFTSDGGANIFPTVGSASATTKANGDALTGSDFHEVNFAHQLAYFCFKQAHLNKDMLGVVGVLPPDSFALKDVSLWVGTLPETDQDANGNAVVSTNGTGLLGNKFMSGRITSGGVPGYTVNGISGLFNGGFIATDDGWLDGTQLTDANDHLVDIGKYISVVATYPILSNPSLPQAYVASGAPTYGGFFSGLPAQDAPTNQVLRSVRLPFRVNTSKLDLLATQRFVTFHAKPKGIVVSDAPSAARPDSDYQRLSTMRIVKRVIDELRAAAEPFLGKTLSGARFSALESILDRKLGQQTKEGLLVRYEQKLSSTAQQRILGQATLELKLVPPFELRQLTIVVALAAV